MSKIAFDFKNPDFGLVRQIVIRRLQTQPNFNQFDYTGDGFSTFVEMQPREISLFAYYACDVCWHFLTIGVLAPGHGAANLKLPWFHLTPFGKAFVEVAEWPVYDESEYLVRLAQRTKNPDPTVLAYLTESLRSFHRGNYVAASVMLGVAAERVFLLLCGATLDALSDANEKAKFGRLMERNPMKPKLEWLDAKFSMLQKRGGPPGFPENARRIVTAIYDLLRSQRNDLGHPREQPPSLDPDDARVNLQIFPRYYQVSEVIRGVLSNSTI